MPDHSLGELNLLNNKIDELLIRYNDLRIKNRELGKENEGLKLKILESEEKVRTLENKYERSKLSGALLGGGENAIEAKKKINELVREIDKCVALLNR
jgi:predicted  nucleic acid-binding Zn-ribbon protein